MTTGTGASGEILLTSPQMYSSSMTSPTTRIFFAGKLLKSCRLVCSVIAGDPRFANDTSTLDNFPFGRRLGEGGMGDAAAGG